MISEYRKRQKELLWREWNSFLLERPVCLLCGKVATDMHEAVPRGWTQPDSDARWLSYLYILTVPVCRWCNMNIADHVESREMLLKLLREKHGDIVDVLLRYLARDVPNLKKYLESEKESDHGTTQKG